ncbi:MAG TPA: thioredoxin family protein [Candidatus Ornithospirochaeta avicola]|uniref:Thioredoxin family protein n=1 Tax=Candidatus Ornithospirochaeta avicola TaxID=2840896 RepID=A0A9D1PV56_9SPIO|nr:thioredoxin family protein [Candidatus Ornithospirochaeta avicola]
MKAKKILQIIVPAIIILIIISMYFIKNNDKEQESAVLTADNHNAETTQDESVALDYSSLYTETLDFELYSSFDKPLIIDFYGEDCYACELMEEDFEKFFAHYSDFITIKGFDAWKHPEINYYFPLQVVPTQFFFNADMTPFIPSESLVEQISGFAYYTDKETGEVVYTVHMGALFYDEAVIIAEEMGVNLD